MTNKKVFRFEIYIPLCSSLFKIFHKSNNNSLSYESAGAFNGMKPNSFIICPNLT